MKHKFVNGICIRCRIARCVNDALPRLCITTSTNKVALDPFTIPAGKAKPPGKPLRKLALH